MLVMISLWFKFPWLYNSFNSLGIKHLPLKYLFPSNVYVFVFFKPQDRKDLPAGAGPSSSFVLSACQGEKMRELGGGGGDADGGEPPHFICSKLWWKPLSVNGNREAF